MTIFNFLTLLGSLSLFLFGMSVMGTALEKRAGGSLKAILAKLTNGKFSGLLTGLAVTAVIQSSSATTVMVVGFVNSGLLSLKQSIPVIMGANIGTTVTAWLLSLSGINGDSLFVQLLKPSSFTPVLAVIGIILYLTAKGKKKDTGLILLGFATAISPALLWPSPITASSSAPMATACPNCSTQFCRSSRLTSMLSIPS